MKTGRACTVRGLNGNMRSAVGASVQWVQWDQTDYWYHFYTKHSTVILLFFMILPGFCLYFCNVGPLQVLQNIWCAVFFNGLCAMSVYSQSRTLWFLFSSVPHCNDFFSVLVLILEHFSYINIFTNMPYYS